MQLTSSVKDLDYIKFDVFKELWFLQLMVSKETRTLQLLIDDALKEG